MLGVFTIGWFQGFTERPFLFEPSLLGRKQGTAFWLKAEIIPVQTLLPAFDPFRKFQGIAVFLDVLAAK